MAFLEYLLRKFSVGYFVKEVTHSPSCSITPAVPTQKGKLEGFGEAQPQVCLPDAGCFPVSET